MAVLPKVLPEETHEQARLRLGLCAPVIEALRVVELPSQYRLPQAPRSHGRKETGETGDEAKVGPPQSPDRRLRIQEAIQPCIV